MTPRRILLIAFGLLLFLFQPSMLQAANLDPLFTDHAVLQRDRKIPVWGTGKNGEKVTVTLDGVSRSTVCSNGTWRVWMDPHGAGGPYAMVLVSAEGTRTVEDLLFGDVFLISGQSNMALTMGECRNPGELLPQIRHFRGYLTSRGSAVANAWQICNPETAVHFSAVGYHFARSLQGAVGVPVGLLNLSYGRTPAESWIPLEVVERVAPDFMAAFHRAVSEWPEVSNRMAEVYRVACASSGNPKSVPVPVYNNPAFWHATAPAKMYERMVRPSLGYGLKGVLWYQGENNVDRASNYTRVLEALIACWRTQWDMPELPFLVVQVAPYSSLTPELREAQRQVVLHTPGTALIPTIDVGEAGNIHPVKKGPVGERAALAARALIYGEKLVATGPLPASLRREGSESVLVCSNTAGALETPGGDALGFEVQGEDGVWKTASASLDGPVVRFKETGITAVRYGWKNVPEASVFGKDEWPMAPFVFAVAK